MLAAALALAVAAAPLDAPAAAPPRAAPVYELHPAADLAVAAASGLAIAVPALFADDLIHPRCPCDRSEVNGVDRGAIGNRSLLADRASDVTVAAAILVPPVLDLWAVGLGDALWTDGAVFAETLLVNGALVQIAKYAVQRPLPRTYAGDPELVASPRGYRSFYSGHASLAFSALGATAMTARLRYGERWWPWAVTAAAGSSVAVERVAAGRHFPSDVAVGALMGTAVGVAVPWLHARRPAVAIVPASRGLSVAARW